MKAKLRLAASNRALSFGCGSWLALSYCKRDEKDAGKAARAAWRVGHWVHQLARTAV